MSTNVGDILQCEKQLRDALHSDDKEKLRRKLALLKREYVRTAQRLQRAERLEAVRKHVRSRISEQNQLDRRESEAAPASRVNSASLMLNTTNAEDQDSAQPQEHAPDSDPSRRSQVIRFILPSDPASPQPSDSHYDLGRGHRPSSALRLRSRQSRLRWERRSVEVDQSMGINLKEQEQSEGIQGSLTVEEEETTVKWRRADAVTESEEKLSGPDSDSPSLLLTHWSAHKKAENGDEEKTENCRLQEERKNRTDVVPDDTCDNLLSTEEAKPSGENKEGDVRKDEEEKKACNEEGNKKVEQTETTEKENKYIEEIKEEKSQTSGEGSEKGLLDSCTLVEGLLFPVEYYVRTTRRMTSSQSQPDIQAVLFSQLSMGRQRRSRGRGGTSRSSERRTHSSPATSSTSPVPLNPSFAQPSNSPPGESPMNSHVGFSPTVTTARPPRGRKKRRGRGRGRPQTPKQSFNWQDSQAPNDVTLSDSLSQSLPSDQPNRIFNSQEGVKEPDSGRPVSASATASQSPSGVTAVQSGSVSAQMEQVYPIFMKHSFKRDTPQLTIRDSPDWTSLLLPPSSSPVQTRLLSFPAPSLCSLVGSLKSLDIHQDFHLPDEHFASLKLHKLRQVAVESGVEHFSTPSGNTRSSLRRSAVPLLLSSTPTATDLPLPDEECKAADLYSDFPDWSEMHTDTLSSSSFTKEHTDTPENVGNVHAGAPHSSTDSVVVQEITQNHPRQPETVAPQVYQCCLSDDIHRSLNGDKIKPHCKLADLQTCSERASSEEQADVCAGQDQSSVTPESKSRTETQNLDWCRKESPEELYNVSTFSQDVGKAEAGASVLNARDPLDSEEPKLNLCEEKQPENKPMCSLQLPDLLTSHLPPAPCPFLSPRLPSTLISSPALPSLGLTPHPVAGVLPLTPSPSAPSLSLPPPRSPSTQALPPPALSPCPSFTVESAVFPTLSCGQRHRSGSPAPAEKPTMRHTHTLEAAAGGLLVDACCFLRASGDVCVAAAGKWAVCLWSQTSASDWSLIHTWNFSELVINVFPVPDAPGLICVTLGQLEIREVRVLSCSSLMQMLICEGIIQVVVGVSKSRVVTSSRSTTGSTLQVFGLSDTSRSQRCQPLVSPGVCVSALAPVDGLPDALIATDEDGCLFIWNTKSGQLLCRVQLEQSLSHTACLRGFSVSGALLVLLQHLRLSSPQVEGKTKAGEPSEESEMALFSLVGINPLTRCSVLVTRLTPPDMWRSRLCEADVNHSCVAALSQSDCVCVWELGRGGGVPQMLKAPEGEDWQLVCWGEADTLVIGHQNGAVSLYCYSADQTSSCL